MGGCLVDDLIEGQRREIGKLDLDDWSHALNRRADGHPQHGIFTDGGILYPSRILGGEILGRLEGSTEVRDVLAVDENGWVVAKCQRLGFANGFKVGNTH